MSEAKAAPPSQCFVMMPFSDPDGYEKAHFQRVYKHLITQACERAGLEPIHLLEAHGATLITADIVRLVTEAPMAICDLSGRNPNVMFELGMRQAVRKPVVLMKDELTGKIFDVDALRTIPYHHSLRADLVEEAIAAIAAALTQTLRDDANGNVVYLVDLAGAAISRQSAANDVMRKEIISELKTEMKASFAHMFKHLAPELGKAARKPSGATQTNTSKALAQPGSGIGPTIQQKLWPTGNTLRVLLMNGTPTQHAVIKAAAHAWAQYANIDFAFTKKGCADIRVAFNRDSGNWSYLGTDAKNIPQAEPTMNLAFMEPGAALKEFGHALGLIQEHMNPDNGIRWNRRVVLKEFGGPPNNWDKATIKHNVLSTYDPAQLGEYRKFDPKSIMTYSFPAALTTDGRGTPKNTELSTSDKALIARLYPGRTKSAKN